MDKSFLSKSFITKEAPERENYQDDDKYDDAVKQFKKDELQRRKFYVDNRVKDTMCPFYKT